MDLNGLIGKKGRYNKDEIAFIIAEGEKAGVPPPPDTSCPDRWRDMAIRVATRQRDSGGKGKSRRLICGAVVFLDRVIPSGVIDDETWEWMMANKFPKHLIEDAED